MRIEAWPREETGIVRLSWVKRGKHLPLVLAYLLKSTSKGK